MGSPVERVSPYEDAAVHPKPVTRTDSTDGSEAMKSTTSSKKSSKKQAGAKKEKASTKKSKKEKSKKEKPT